MPQLVKGAKHTFGWSIMSKEGEIRIPTEALEEYGFKVPELVLLIPGSRTSGGFSAANKRTIANSKLSSLLDQLPQKENAKAEIRGRMLCWVRVNDDGKIIIPQDILKIYGLKAGDRLLTVRGSSLGLGFIARGPIIKEAEKHTELKKY